MKIVALPLLCLVFLAACQEGWTDENKRNYKQSCLEETAHWGISPTQAESYCNCSLEKVMRHYPTIGEVLENKDSLQLQEELKACRKAALAAP